MLRLFSKLSSKLNNLLSPKAEDLVGGLCKDAVNFHNEQASWYQDLGRDHEDWVYLRSKYVHFHSDKAKLYKEFAPLSENCYEPHCHVTYPGYVTFL
jgi:hypothetical protein